MARTVNLRNIVVAFRGLQDSHRDRLFKIWGIKPRESELISIERLVNELVSLSPLDPKLTTLLLDGCFFGFSIPRISKEFDCLWIGENTVINLELKSQSVNEEKIKRQLSRNRYYLRHLSKNIISYSFDASTGCCFKLDKSNNLKGTDVKELGRALYEIHKEKLWEDGIEDMFPPEKFLVSPFNSTNEFLDGRYFLTDHQQRIKEEISKFVESSSDYFCAITGGPGSGKTLLMYDIARSLSANGKTVVIGHAGALNSGHVKLNDNGWSIYSTKDLLKYSAELKAYVL